MDLRLSSVGGQSAPPAILEKWLSREHETARAGERLKELWVRFTLDGVSSSGGLPLRSVSTKFVNPTCISSWEEDVMSSPFATSVRKWVGGGLRGIALSSFVAGSAAAAIPDLVWAPSEAVDAAVTEVSPSGGVSVEYWGGSVWITYVKQGEVYVAERTEAGWRAPLALSNDPSASRSPVLHRIADLLVVVWEDERSGRPEVWARIHDGASWSPETMLSPNDAVASRAPVLAGDDLSGLVAWEEATVPSRIDGRWYDEVAFASTVTLASGAADMREPTVVASPLGFYVAAHLAWVDLRHGEEEIYYRSVEPTVLGAEVRVSDLSGPCRRPSISSGLCCGDIGSNFAWIVFENTGVSGIAEVWSAPVIDDASDFVQRLSDDDGVPSVRPNAVWMWWNEAPQSWCGELGGSGPRRFVTWSDLAGGGARRHALRLDDQWTGVLGSDLLSTVGQDGAVVGSQGFSEPRAGVTAAWIEMRAGQPTLVAQSGDILSCRHTSIEYPLALLLSPSGFPATSIRYEDTCSGGPSGQGRSMNLFFTPALNAALHWDPLQQHPTLTGTIDANGEWNVPIRGGGCSQAGDAVLKCGGLTQYVWEGAKSPDVDGDCAVRDNDVEYVQSKVGTTDFCADLDESGTVDASDVAIVQATLGDACNFVVGVDDPRARAGGLAVRAAPNPSAGVVQIALWTEAGASGVVRIVDAAGRVVADLGRHRFGSGREVLRWDGIDARGHAVASGVYFAELRSGARSARTPILIVR